MKNQELAQETIKTIESIENRIETLKFQMRMQEGCIIKNCWIATVGAYTVCKNEKGYLDTSLKTLPSQWCEDGIREMQSKKVFKNRDGGDVEIEVIYYKDWYQKKLDSNVTAVGYLKRHLEEIQK